VLPYSAALVGTGLGDFVSSSGPELNPATGALDLPARPAAGLYVDLQGRAAYLDGRSVPLTAREYLLIELLYTSRGRLFSRDDILERLWGLDFPGDDRVVDTYVKRLRSKLGQGAVQTVRGLGYRCPLAEGSGVAQPHLEKLPPEARLLTLLAGRILQVTDPGHIILGVYELLQEHSGVGGVSLWSLPTRTRLAQAGRQVAAPDLQDGPAQALVALGTGVVGEEPWALLAFVAQPEQLGGPEAWSTTVRPALDAVAGLVNPALRLNGEITRRQHAEAQIRSLNHDLEQRVQARTHDLARANADLRSLYNLAQQLSGALSLQEVWSRGLSGLARLAGASVCALWRLGGPGPYGAVSGAGGPHCLAAASPDGQDLMVRTQAQAALLSEVLAQSRLPSRAQVPGQPLGQDQRRLTRRAELPGGRQALVIPAAPGLPEVYALHLELPAALEAGEAALGDLPMPDLGLLDAAARAFGLAFERQMQTLTLEQVALSDELTGLPNRRALLADLTAELAYSQRHGSALTLSLFELPDIRTVNRHSGFAAGNDLIRALSAELLRTLRTEDRVYRLSGAVLASLVRSGETPLAAPPGAALAARLDEMAMGFGTSPAPTWAHGEGAVRVSHVQAPAEASELSAVLHLALQRLEQSLTGLTQDGEAS
jgi:GGDEF domain-containing protein